MSLIVEPIIDEHKWRPTSELRWRGKMGTTTEPRKLEQRWACEDGSSEWRGIVLFLD